jgi:hypothetical protein
MQLYERALQIQRLVIAREMLLSQRVQELTAVPRVAVSRLGVSAIAVVLYKRLWADTAERAGPQATTRSLYEESAYTAFTPSPKVSPTSLPVFSFSANPQPL